MKDYDGADSIIEKILQVAFKRVPDIM
ncbi:uncharacterized protein METZ01_LOCUS283852 [marine metagenome]|uniref:Uncharacterized protein n=1 Tax=marine metagenome TaxID=408172 RepID=A0A382L202_9ZZZZ